MSTGAPPSPRELPLDAAEREKLLTEHLPEVRYIARRIHERLPVQIPLEDLVHAGVLGLIDAVDKFDRRRDVQLKSYAKFRIRGAILDSLRASDWSPRRLRKQARLVEETARNLSSELGRSPTEIEIAERMGVSLLDLQHLLGELQGLDLGTLEVEVTEEFDESANCTYRPNSSEENPFFQCMQSELKSFLARALDSLEEKERQVMALYYLEELTMKEVGAVLGIGESRVSQLHSLALVRLRERLQELLQTNSAAHTITPFGSLL
ncbi:MAG TPA: FliA/WhiG family RNA polymerase sigma factor [Candidatus Acidoferrales bacterium]|jgi:RNA polymerase sigma factor for flagellar operon FliA|nr:FliA/WhiG family RNA polymerase sigma factor [Candidatus Acidoferrales bacterium]